MSKRRSEAREVDEETTRIINEAKKAHGVTVVVDERNHIVTMLVVPSKGGVENALVCHWTPDHARVVAYGLLEGADHLDPIAQDAGGSNVDTQ